MEIEYQLIRVASAIIICWVLVIWWDETVKQRQRVLKAFNEAFNKKHPSTEQEWAEYHSQYSLAELERMAAGYAAVDGEVPIELADAIASHTGSLTRQVGYLDEDEEDLGVYCDVCGHHWDRDDPCPYH